MRWLDFIDMKVVSCQLFFAIPIYRD